MLHFWIHNKREKKIILIPNRRIGRQSLGWFYFSQGWQPQNHWWSVFLPLFGRKLLFGDMWLKTATVIIFFSFVPPQNWRVNCLGDFLPHATSKPLSATGIVGEIFLPSVAPIWRAFVVTENMKSWFTACETVQIQMLASSSRSSENRFRTSRSS